jgi:hypothetical protein
MRQRIRDLEEQVEDQAALIRCLERGERRIRIWAVVHKCQDCDVEHTEYVALVNRKIYQASDYKKLEARLRLLGYFIKKNNYDEAPPREGKPFDGECDYICPSGDIREIKLPDGVGPEILEQEST